MSIELNKLAAEFNRYFTSSNGVDVPAKVSVSRDEWRALFDAIQQAEAKTDKPAAVRNPFASRCYTMSESHLSGHRLIVGFEKLVDAQDAHEWVARQGLGDFTHPAPSVPAGYVSVPVQVLRDAADSLGNFINDLGWGDSDMQAMDNLDAYIARHEANRAAMLAAKDTI